MDKREIKFKVFYHNKLQGYEKLSPEGWEWMCLELNPDKGERWTNGVYPENKDYQRVQFTGLLDNKGKEIWESDYFEVADNKIYQVKYMEGGESNHEWYGGCFVLWLNEEVFFPFDEYAMKHGKIIGDIYSSPSLLTKQ